MGTVTRLAAVGESWNLCVLAPPALAKYLAYKGSITVNGVSLTVNHVADRADGCEVSINLIPHTMQHTALGTLMVGARVDSGGGYDCALCRADAVARRRATGRLTAPARRLPTPRPAAPPPPPTPP